MVNLDATNSRRRGVQQTDTTDPRFQWLWRQEEPGLVELWLSTMAVGPRVGGFERHLSRTVDGFGLAGWIERRPAYCDRGHWRFQTELPAVGIDSADCFPRYFMELDVAKREAVLWTRWRLFRERADVPAAVDEMLRDMEREAAQQAGTP